MCSKQGVCVEKAKELGLGDIGSSQSEPTISSRANVMTVVPTALEAVWSVPVTITVFGRLELEWCERKILLPDS